MLHETDRQTTKLWFRNKRYGLGWYPLTWQGWVVILVYVILIAAFALTVDADSSPREVIFTCILPICFLTGVLLRICYKKGEKLRWRWGDKS